MPKAKKTRKDHNIQTIMTTIWAKLAFLAVFYTLAGFSTGCSSGGSNGVESSDAPPAEPTVDIIINQGSSTQVDVEPRRLPGDIEWAVEKTHWATLSRQVVEQQPDPNHPVQADVPIAARQAAKLYRLRALLPDGRHAMILGWVQTESRVSVAVKVGHFGDTQQERLYLKQIAKLMSGKPRPERGGDFGLPGWEPIKEQLKKQIDQIKKLTPDGEGP